MAAPRISLFDAHRNDAPLQAELREAFARVLDSGRYILGGTVALFEDACAERLGTAHAIGVSSGSDAVLLSLRALGVGPGDEVICPTFTFVATAEAIVRLGARPVFVDCALDEFDMDVDHVAAAVSERTRVIIAVHLFGRVLDVSPLLALARRRSISVVEDAAQAFGAVGAHGAAGATAQFGCFSFFPTKTLGAIGDGGLVATQDAESARRIRALRQHGRAEDGTFVSIGGNHRLDAVQAALLHVKLRHLDSHLASLRHVAARYRAGFAGTSVRCPVAASGSIDSPFVTRVPVERRDAIELDLRRSGIETGAYYRVPIHRQPAYRRFASQPLPRADALSREVLALPMFAGLVDAECDEIVDLVRASLR